MARAEDERKRRTREHVIADLSVNHLERSILEEGHVALRMAADYGYDLGMQTFDEDGKVEPGSAYWQLKASESLASKGGTIPFDLDVRDYNAWTREPMPVLLMLYDVSKRRGYWLHVQDYFGTAGAPRPRRGASTIRVRIPETQVVNRRSIRQVRHLKQEALSRFALRVLR